MYTQGPGIACSHAMGTAFASQARMSELGLNGVGNLKISSIFSLFVHPQTF